MGRGGPRSGSSSVRPHRRRARPLAHRLFALPRSKDYGSDRARHAGMTGVGYRRAMRPPPFPRPVVLLAFTSLFADISTEMLYPVLPLFLTTRLGAPASAVGAPPWRGLRPG